MPFGGTIGGFSPWRAVLLCLALFSCVVLSPWVNRINLFVAWVQNLHSWLHWSLDFLPGKVYISWYATHCSACCAAQGNLIFDSQSLLAFHYRQALKTELPVCTTSLLSLEGELDTTSTWPEVKKIKLGSLHEMSIATIQPIKIIPVRVVREARLDLPPFFGFGGSLSIDLW